MIRNRLNEIVLLRPILILTIIIGHIFAIYGDSPSWPLPEGITYPKTYEYINPIFISFSLQTFVFISGYLFCYQTLKRPTTLLYLLKKKTNRLLIPSIIFSLIYYFTIEYQPIDNIFSFIHKLIRGIGHLWFLPMLFWCFILMCGLKKIFYKFTLLNIVLIFVIWGLSLFIPDFLRLGTSFFYLPFFIIGFWTYKYNCNIKKYISKYRYLSWLFVIVGCFFKIYILENIVSHELFFLFLLKISLGITGAFACLGSAYYIKKKINSTSLSVIDWQGYFGIYIIHQFIIKYLYYQTDISHFPFLMNPFIIFITTLIASYIIVQLLSKLKMGRYLLG